MKKYLFISLILCIVFIVKAEVISDTTKKEHFFRISKGAHFFKPRNLTSRLINTPDTLVWQCRFDTSCNYIMLNADGSLHVDQWDFNKIAGIAFNLLNPMANTAMVGWRFNPDKHWFELLPYWHVGKKRFYDEKNLFIIRENQTFTITTIINKNNKAITIELSYDGLKLTESKIFDTLPNTAALIHPYFGGTSPAPKSMRLMCTIVKKV
jgi:hypothetical protein